MKHILGISTEEMCARGCSSYTVMYSSLEHKQPNTKDIKGTNKPKEREETDQWKAQVKWRIVIKREKAPSKTVEEWEAEEEDRGGPGRRRLRPLGAVIHEAAFPSPLISSPSSSLLFCLTLYLLLSVLLFSFSPLIHAISTRHRQRSLAQVATVCHGSVISLAPLSHVDAGATWPPLTASSPPAPFAMGDALSGNQSADF